MRTDSRRDIEFFSNKTNSYSLLNIYSALGTAHTLTHWIIVTTPKRTRVPACNANGQPCSRGSGRQVAVEPMGPGRTSRRRCEIISRKTAFFL